MDPFESVEPALPLAGYFGGKRGLAKRLVAEIEARPHVTYAEPFVGMGGVYFRRRKRPKGEIVNDINQDIANLFRCVQNHPDAVAEGLRWMLTSRAEVARQRAMDPARLTDIQRAVRYVYLQRHAFAGNPRKSGLSINKESPAKMNGGKLLELIARAHRRLSRASIECLPWREFVDRYDRPTTLFYVDPPYDGHEADYGPGIFAPADLDALAARLARIRGQFVLSINDTPRMRALFGRFKVREARVSYASHSPGARRPEGRELIVTNT